MTDNAASRPAPRQGVNESRIMIGVLHSCTLPPGLLSGRSAYRLARRVSDVSVKGLTGAQEVALVA